MSEDKNIKEFNEKLIENRNITKTMEETLQKEINTAVKKAYTGNQIITSNIGFRDDNNIFLQINGINPQIEPLDLNFLLKLQYQLTLKNIRISDERTFELIF